MTTFPTLDSSRQAPLRRSPLYFRHRKTADRHLLVALALLAIALSLGFTL